MDWAVLKILHDDFLVQFGHELQRVKNFIRKTGLELEQDGKLYSLRDVSALFVGFAGFLVLAEVQISWKETERQEVRDALVFIDPQDATITIQEV